MNKQVVLIGVIAVLIAVIKQTHADGWTSATTGCISGYDIRQLSGKTVESCKQRCVDETECLSIDFYIRSGRCFLNSIRKEDVMRDNPGAWKAWNTCELYELTQDSDMDECESDPCQNEATCNDGPDGYNCSCADGFEGEHCETNIDECESAECLNGGTCKDGAGAYTCSCADGYEGEHCETNAGVLPIRLNCHVCGCGSGVDCVPSSFPGVCMSRDCLSLRASFSG